jgi:hypothetical protein
VDNAIRTIRDATRESHSDRAELLCDLAEKLMRSGREPLARPVWAEARAEFPDDVWTYVQAGIEYGDIGDHATALTWLTPGMELALRTGDPESALEQLIPLRGSCLSALGRQPDDVQPRQGWPRQPLPRTKRRPKRSRTHEPAPVRPEHPVGGQEGRAAR